MKRFLVFLLITVSLLTGCEKKETFEEAFIRKYDIEVPCRVNELKTDDVIYQVTHGTHVILLSGESEGISTQINELTRQVSEISGMTVFCYDSEKGLPDEVLSTLSQMVGILDKDLEVNGREALLLFIKKGELIDCYYVTRLPSDYAEIFRENLKNMKDDNAPGCHDC